MKTRGFLPRGRWTRGRNRFLTSGVTRVSSPHGGPLVSIPGRVEDVVNLDVAIVLDVLDLLTITRGFLQSLDDQGSGGRDHVDLGLTVLDGQPYGNLQTFPVLGGFGDVVTDFLGGQTQGTNLGGQGRGSGDLSSDSTKADNL